MFALIRSIALRSGRAGKSGTSSNFLFLASPFAWRAFSYLPRFFLGVVGYHGIDWASRSTTLGYWLGEEFQGQGLMTEACGATVEHAFGELGLNRVGTVCATDNHRSRAIPERSGFRREGVQRQAEWLYDHFVDHVMYARLRGDVL